MDATNSNILLAIESAVRGGSLALFIDGQLSRSWLGTSDISRAEDLLLNIKVMLEDAGLDRRRIGAVVLSSGPGSYTGIRIGIATALGLKNALDIECRSVSALQAMAAASKHTGQILAAVPTGKHDAAWQPFQKTENSTEPMAEPVSDTAERFFEHIKLYPNARVLLHSELFESFQSADLRNVDAADSGRNLAVLIGIASLQGHGSLDFEPMYLRNSQLRPGIY